MELNLVNYYGDLIKYIYFKHNRKSKSKKIIRKDKVMFYYDFHNQENYGCK